MRPFTTSTGLLPNVRNCILIAAIGVSTASTGWSASLDNANVRAPKSGATWIAAPDMHFPRNYHTATRMLDGRVLVASGRRDCCSTPLSSAEIFDPATNTWTDAAGMPVGLLGAGVLLKDGRVMILGDPGDGTGPVVELYDPSTNSWVLIGGLQYRISSTVTVLPSGKVLIAGGTGSAGALDTAVLFDPTTSTWSDTGRLHDKRGGAVATMLRDGRVLIFGGEVPTQNIELPDSVTTAEIYDPATEKWTPTTSPNRVYATPSATLLPDGRVLVLGDVGDTEQYDPATARWTISGTRDGERGPYAFAQLFTGQVLTAGGSDPNQHYVDGVELYDPTTGTWSRTASLLTARFGHTATSLMDGRVLVTGGVGAGTDHEVTLAKTEIYQGVVAIGPGFTGAWFNPAQNGHGLFVEVLPGQRLLAAWFTFDPAGNPAWFLGVGSYSGNTATINAVDQPSGADAGFPTSTRPASCITRGALSCSRSVIATTVSSSSVARPATAVEAWISRA